MNYATIKKYDIANGSGMRMSLFVSGCTHHCPGCFNAEAWDFDYGSPFTDEVAAELLQSMDSDYVDGLSLLGGEPLEPANQEALLPLLRQFRKRFPEKNVWCYTGYTLESDLLDSAGRAHCSATAELLSLLDVLVDGEFVEAKKNIRLKFRGSENQRIIDLPQSLKTGQTVLLKKYL